MKDLGPLPRKTYEVRSAHGRVGAAGSEGPAQPQVTPSAPQAQSAGTTVRRHTRCIKLADWRGRSHKCVITEEGRTTAQAVSRKKGVRGAGVA